MAFIKLYVEYQDNDYVKLLKTENERLKSEVELLKKRCDDISRKAIREFHVNNELVDLLRENGIEFRPSAILSDYKEYYVL